MDPISPVGGATLRMDRYATAPPASAAEAVPAPSTAGGGLGDPTPVFGIGFLLVWVTSGFVTAFVLKRRGHEFRPAAVLGFVLGPLLIPLAMGAERRARSQDTSSLLVSEGGHGSGPVDVLVGLVGPPDSAPSVIPILSALDDRRGRLTLARVLASEPGRLDGERAGAALELYRAALFLSEYEPSILLIAGHPRTALMAHATKENYDLLIVVGARTPGRMSRWVAGSGKSKASVPILLAVDAPRCER